MLVLVDKFHEPLFTHFTGFIIAPKMCATKIYNDNWNPRILNNSIKCNGNRLLLPCLILNNTKIWKVSAIFLNTLQIKLSIGCKCFYSQLIQFFPCFILKHLVRLNCFAYFWGFFSYSVCQCTYFYTLYSKQVRSYATRASFYLS